MTRHLLILILVQDEIFDVRQLNSNLVESYIDEGEDLLILKMNFRNFIFYKELNLNPCGQWKKNLLITSNIFFLTPSTYIIIINIYIIIII